MPTTTTTTAAPLTVHCIRYLEAVEYLLSGQRGIAMQAAHALHQQRWDAMSPAEQNTVLSSDEYQHVATGTGIVVSQLDDWTPPVVMDETPLFPGQ